MQGSLARWARWLAGSLDSLAHVLRLYPILSLVTPCSLALAPFLFVAGTAFEDRVEFNNDWKFGSEHGLVHDGLQGDGHIDLRMDWKTEEGGRGCALLRVVPWLSYGCSEGARLAMRKPEETEGRRATVQRSSRPLNCDLRVSVCVCATRKRVTRRPALGG